MSIHSPGGWSIPCNRTHATCLAAGGATLRWRGSDWAVIEPHLVGLDEAAPALGRFNAAAARRAGIETYLRVRLTSAS